MKTLQFKCTLLSDVIINQKAATEGSQQTLDFIPGNAFLGVAAAIYNDLKPDEAFVLFHSGQVRFGDAHPFVDNQRAMRIPASWYAKKGDADKSELFVHHGMPNDGLKDEKNNPVQVKQCRDGFIVKKNDSIVSEVKIKKNFAIKSAYDSDKRRSEDQKMYGYQSLEAGSEWCFEVTIDELAKEHKTRIVDALVGKKRIGRSSTAQFGLVEIEEIKDSLKTNFGGNAKLKLRLHEEKTNENYEKEAIFLYAESRLIFLDNYGQPTFTPTINQLGLTKGEIDWSKSQIRTFQYSPYNNHRKTRDTDRCGIEKGSVICITGLSFSDVEISKIENGVGAYLNEGFGKVLVNPEFLAYQNEFGQAVFSIDKDKVTPIGRELSVEAKSLPSDDSILKYLQKQKTIKDKQKQIYVAVNLFVEDNSRYFKGGTFASQWGTIRSIAMKSENKQNLFNALFLEEYDNVKNKKVGKGYLVHGVAAEKWEGNKVKDLEKFIKGLDEKIANETVVNLAAEMAKKCKKEGNK